MNSYYQISVRKTPLHGWEAYDQLADGVIENLAGGKVICEQLVENGEYYAAGLILYDPRRNSAPWSYLTTREHGPTDFKTVKRKRRTNRKPSNPLSM